MELDLLNKTQAQIDKCREKYGDYASRHEFLGILIEEIEELKAEIFKKEPDFKRIEAEMVDVLTVVFKGYDDIVLKENKR